MKKANSWVKHKNIIYSLAGALIVTVLCGVGLFKRPDMWTQDALFQTPQAVPGDIVVIGLDETDIQELGPYNTWDRSVYADALEVLASDPDNLPAVVAIDTLYSGETSPEADAALVDACSKLDVVVATTADFGTERSFVGDTVITNSFAILNYEEPFAALKAVTTLGHINAMYDTDGVLRHALLYVEPEEGRQVYSMAYQTAKIYMEKQGLSIETPPTNSRGQFYVPFYTGPGGFYDGVSLNDLITGKVPSSYYAGKIVFIGPYTVGLQDSYFTPIARDEQMYGIEYQANVAQCFLDGNYREEIPEPLQLITVFAVCGAFFYICFNRKLRFSVVLCALFIGAGLFGSYLLYENGYVTHALWIPVGVFILFVVSVAVNYFRAAVARQQVTRTFERYVAPNIVSEILKEGTDALKLGGNNVDIAVLFVDIRGFTTMSERLSPEEVVFILNRYLTMTSNCVENNEGTLDKFVGDCTMAFWGAPLPQENAVYLAAKTAMDIVKGAAELSAALKEEIGEELNVGVGVHYGPAVVGNMGSERHMDYTAIGDTVNTSARLEANAPKGTVYISRTVADKLGDLAKTRSLGDTVKLKGKAEGFEVLVLESLEEI
ncbi:MAG: adenylate/guanylate cyclase domain-containing protein [Clostridiales bacterium]|nr:adenylate/guanylate cyclase domain-containing protein [Clostridiales bacterium]